MPPAPLLGTGDRADDEDAEHGGEQPAASIDVAFLCDAYHHLELPNTYLADLRRALGPDGRSVVIDYDRTRPGTKAWMKEHIRADPGEFRREIEAAWFVLSASPAVLVENFFWVFELDDRVARAR
ncbi:MAG: methyltransferase domain-containing protein [Nannocystis sp.]|nr:methyltransferase domain-containing protein [Nannocystis sp.]